MEMDYDRYDEWDKSLCDNCKRWTFDEFHSADGDIEISSSVFGFRVGENFQNKKLRMMITSPIRQFSFGFRHPLTIMNAMQHILNILYR